MTAVAGEIEVLPSGNNAQDDTAVAEAIKRAFEWSTIIPDTSRPRCETVE